MTVSPTSYAPDLYNGNGATVNFSITFPFYEITVVHINSSGTETTWTENTQYTVSGGDGATGTLTVITSPTDYTPASGEQLRIERSTTKAQNTDYDIDNQVLEDGLQEVADRSYMLIQELFYDLARSIKLSRADYGSVGDLVFPSPVANQLVKWNAAANALETTALADLSTTLSTVEQPLTFISNTLDIDFSTLSAGDITDLSNALSVEIPVATSLTALKGLTANVNSFVLMTGYASAGDGGEGFFRWDASDLSTEVTADTRNAFYVPPNSDATGASGAWVRISKNIAQIGWFGVNADGSTDDATAIQAAIDSAVPVYFDAKTYAVASTLNIKDGTKLIGAGAFWKRRSGYASDEGSATVFKYTGSTGSNTCVVNVSSKAVGTEASDLTAPGTDDLVNVTLRGIHVDCDNKADIGWNFYRCGNQSSIGDLTAEKAVKRCMIFTGIFAAKFGHFGCYESEEHGCEVGQDYFSYTSSTEHLCYEFEASFHLVNNGTDGTYVAGTGTDLDGSGGIFGAGRGSKITITSEGNDGRAFIVNPNYLASATDGPVFYELPYMEGNAAGPYIYYYTGSRGMHFRNGFVHPGNGGSLLVQDWQIEARTNAGTITTNEGPSDKSEWIVIENLFGNLSGTAWDIDSNTYKYRIRNCDKGITFSDKTPQQDGIIAAAYFKADATLSDTRTEDGCTVSRAGAGQYRINFSNTESDALYVVSISMLGSNGNNKSYMQGKTTTYVDVRTVAESALTTNIDTGDFLDVIVYRAGALY